MIFWYCQILSGVDSAKFWTGQT